VAGTHSGGHPRTAVITGAAHGIGQEFARRLARDGIRIVVADIEDATETLELVSQEGSEGIAVSCDVSSQESFVELYDAAQEFGGADIVVNNAGIYPFQPFQEITLGDWRRVQAVNVEGLFHLTQTFLPTMRERSWGRIVALTSGMFNTGVPGAVHYVASKGAITGFVRGLAGEIAGDNITINAIAPGLTRSPGTIPYGEMGMFEGAKEMQAIKRTELPSDLSGSLAFLVSDEASFMTGQTLLIDGGVGRT
jgi:NAD(P)-dependent dehydrogenase (short-subunit alcohol dehydrogenase family)